MLESLRRYSNSTGIKILYGLLASLFVLWGIGAVGGDRIQVVAQVYGDPITRRELEHATAQLQQRYDEIFKGRMPLAGLDLRARAFDDLINEALLKHEARRLGLEVTDTEVVNAITTLPQLQENGRFSRDLLQRLLDVQRDRGEFEEDIRRSLLFQRVQSLVTDGAQVTDAEVESRFQLDHEQIDLDIVKVSAAELAATVTPTDAELASTLERNPDRYRIPEKTRAHYVVYRRAEFQEKATISDQQIADYYNDHKDQRFTDPEQVRARHILVKVEPGASDDAKAAARKKAEDLLKRVHAGEDFAALARKHSQDPGSAEKGGDLGSFPRGRMVPAFDAAAFALEPGATSDIVETTFGFHIIRVEEHQAGGARPLEAVRDEIVQKLKEAQGLELARAQAEGDRRQIARGKTLADLGAERPVADTPPFARTDTAIVGIGRVPGFAEAAFALSDGQVSDLIETEDAVYLLSPFEHVDAHAPTVADVRDRLVADSRHDRGETLARQKAEGLLEKAKADGLTKAAADAKLAVTQTGLFDRRAPAIPTLGPAPDLRTDAFALTPAAPLASKVYNVGGDAVVASLREHKPADMTEFAAAKDALRDSMLQQKRSTLLANYMDFLKERARKDGALEVRADALGRS